MAIVIWLLVTYSIALAWFFLAIKKSGPPTEDMYFMITGLFILAPILMPIALWAGIIWKVVDWFSKGK